MPSKISFRNAKLYKKSKSTTPRTPRSAKSGNSKETFTQKVQKIITRNIENKKTIAAQAVSPVCQFGVTQIPVWYTLKDWDNNVWKIAQGSAQAQRTGDKVKMKRWIIKGQIMPDCTGMAFNESGYLRSSFQGYVTLYFGRRRDGQSVQPDLAGLFDSGNSAVKPIGSSVEMMLPLNNQLYKVYWRKTFKLGTSIGSFTSTQQNANNDFGMVRTFGFDVCKYIMKNRILQFDDTDDRTTDRDMKELAMWAVWRPAIGSLFNPNVYITNSFYSINLTSYGEYEDA